MTRRSGSSARSQALAKAAQAVARRDAQRIAREKSVQAALAEFFHAEGEIERIHAEADKAAAPFEQITRNAVRALDRLGETRTGIADLTGLPVMRVRDYVLEDAGSERTARSAPPSDAGFADEAEKPGSDGSSVATEGGHGPRQSQLR